MANDDLASQKADVKDPAMHSIAHIHVTFTVNNCHAIDNRPNLKKYQIISMWKPFYPSMSSVPKEAYIHTVIHGYCLQLCTIT